jgi:nucleoid-associated protein YejK
MWYRTSTADNLQTDPIVDRVINKFHDRSQAGIKKYGTMLTRTDYELIDWLKEAQAEAMDWALYCEAAINRIQKDGSKTT